MSSQELQNFLEINNSDYIFTDFFDTLIHRRVAPEQIKKIWCARIKDIYNLTDSPQDLYLLRNHIEVNLGSQSLSSGKDSEMDIENLYSKFKEKARIDAINFTEVSKKLELSIELSLSYLDKETVELLYRNKSNGKKIVLISDFYFTKAMIEEYLGALGILDLFDQIFVSSETLETKRSGSLYKRVLNKLNITPRQAIMIGDNVNADFTIPSKLGIRSFLVKADCYHDFYNKYSECDLEDEIVELLSQSNKTDIFPEFGFELFVFIKKLTDNLIREGEKNILFLAREGQLLKELFDLYTTKYLSFFKFNSNYFFCSRKSTFLPSLDCATDESFSTLFSKYSSLSLADFFENLGLTDYIDEFKQDLIGVNIYETIGSFAKSKIFCDLLENKKFLSLYEKKRSEQKQLFVKYLEGFTNNLSNDKLILVDIGWNGTIQDNIQKVFSNTPSLQRIQLKGYYFGLEGSDTKQKVGLVFSSNSKDIKIFLENRSLYELLLPADHPSTKGYQLYGNSVAPKFDNFDEKDIIFSKALPTRVSFKTTFENISKLYSQVTVTNQILYNILINFHTREVFQPNEAEINWFFSMRHKENFGVMTETIFTSAKNKLHTLDKIYYFYKIFLKKDFTFLGLWPCATIKNILGERAASIYIRKKIGKFL